MGYPIFAKTKTITLPVPVVQLSLEEYKDRYGIDLKEFIYIDDGYIKLKPTQALILFDFRDACENFAYTDIYSGIVPIAKVENDQYSEGAVHAELKLYEPSGALYCGFRNSKDETLALDNVTICAQEV